MLKGVVLQARLGEAKRPSMAWTWSPSLGLSRLCWTPCSEAAPAAPVLDAPNLLAKAYADRIEAHGEVAA